MSNFSNQTWSDSGSTSASLIYRARQREPDAWQRLTNLYVPLVYTWARRSNLSESDAADVVQEVFRCVWQHFDQFQQDRIDGSFRGWLSAITRNQVRLVYRHQADLPRGVGGDLGTQELQAVPEEFSDDGSSSSDNHRLLWRALELVRSDFNERTWQSFWRLTMEGHSAAEIATDLELSENAVRQAKFRVLRRLRQELDDRIE
jgi:RNA polymerase sigma-70 factor, ECF subfamily